MFIQMITLYLCNNNKQIEIMDYLKITNVYVDGIDTNDYPDFCDAFIASAEYDGVDMTEEQLDEINEHYDFVYECVVSQIF